MGTGRHSFADAASEGDVDGRQDGDRATRRVKGGVDCEFLVGGSYLHGHRVVLASRSPVLRDMIAQVRLRTRGVYGTATQSSTRPTSIALAWPTRPHLLPTVCKFCSCEPTCTGPSCQCKFCLSRGVVDAESNFISSMSRFLTSFGGFFRQRIHSAVGRDHRSLAPSDDALQILPFPGQ